MSKDEMAKEMQVELDRAKVPSTPWGAAMWLINKFGGWGVMALAFGGVFWVVYGDLKLLIRDQSELAHQVIQISQNDNENKEEITEAIQATARAQEKTADAVVDLQEAIIQIGAEARASHHVPNWQNSRPPNAP